MTINGQITARGGSQASGAGPAASGAIKIIANQILGNGTIDASGRSSGNLSNNGRTRMEANVISPSLNIFPNAAAVASGTNPGIWPAANAPTVRVVSVGGQNAPLDPLAGVSTSSDIGLQTNSAVTILLEARNLPINGTVSLRITPKYGSVSTVNATNISGDVNVSTWRTSAVMPPGYCVLQARATAP